VDPTTRPSHIAIARIVRTRGIRGEVLAELHTDFPTRFRLLHRVQVRLPDERYKSLELEHSWEHKGRQVLKFSGVDSIAEAEVLIGAWIEIEADQAVPLPEGAYWDHDLVGCTLRSGSGEVLGVVGGVMRIAGNSQLVVQGARGEFFVPIVASICKEISIPNREILVDLPEGLMDLNQ
jgi:16S rRNA processing protein RimM